MRQEAHFGQEVVPVMLAAAYQRQDLLYRVAGVDRDIEQALSQPEQAELPAQVGAAPLQVDQADGGYQELGNSSAQHAYETPEEAQENMAGFVEGGVHEIQRREIVFFGEPARIEQEKDGDHSRPGPEPAGRASFAGHGLRGRPGAGSRR